MFAVWILFQPVWMSELFKGWVWNIAVFSLVFGNLMAIALNMLATARRKLDSLFFLSFTNPIYWIMHSIAAYMALWQLLTKPHYWEKTNHGLTTMNLDHMFETPPTAHPPRTAPAPMMPNAPDAIPSIGSATSDDKQAVAAAAD